MSSREFNQDAGGAKKAAGNGPVFITDRCKPAHVLLTIEDYKRLAGAKRKIADALAIPAKKHVEFEPEKVRIRVRPADLR